ncbi:MAG TPA: GAF domain-containing sensor histidine kinase [Candidatus Binatia bacterium]|jgi:signal transduction histidine kinase|nr:GAF domain-containing sensor histidine kinase [Candidatus Binatia bacterium]
MDAEMPQEKTPLPTRIRSPHDIFRLLVLYRWISLVAPVLALLSRPVEPFRQLLPLALAILPNMLITFDGESVNRTLRRRPALLIVDLLLVSGLIALTGGASSPYYLYALSPLIAAGFFFHLHGALLAATALAPLYLIASSGLISGGSAAAGVAAVDWLRMASNLVGFYLLSGAFGYAAALLTQLRATSEELALTHSDLLVLHEITASLHTADDEARVQEKLLTALTAELGFRQVVLGLVDESEPVISSWVIHRAEGEEFQGVFDAENVQGRLTHAARLPLDESGGLVARALSDGTVCKVQGEACTVDRWLNEQLRMNSCLIVPIRWGIQPVGVLLFDCTGQIPDETRKRSLEAIAGQTAVIIGMMRTRGRRARESAAQAERARIALDIHDVVSQSLFGLVFTLDGTLKLLDTQPEAVRRELESALQTAERVRQEIRRSVHDMWTEEITPQGFEVDLHRYIVDILQAHNLAVNFEIGGDFSALSPVVRRSLYRVAQESLTNVVHHAAASEVRVCVDVAEQRARLVVRDNGRGFEPDVALARVYEGAQNEARFGLRGMQERARALGGTCDIYSCPGAGASVVVDLPANARFGANVPAMDVGDPATGKPAR